MTELDYNDERLGLPSASKMHMIVECEGQPNMERDMRARNAKSAAIDLDSDDKEWKDRGTRIHAAFESGNTLDLDDIDEPIYQQAVKYEAMIVEKWMSDLDLPNCTEGPREHRIFILDPFNWPNPLASVKMDRHYLCPEKGAILITDLKSGYNPLLPPSPRSWQLRFAAVAAKQEDYKWATSIRVAYCKAQTRHTVKDYCDYNETDLQYSWDSLRLHLWKSRQPDASRHAGAHCRYCPCKAECPEAGAYALLPTVIAGTPVGMAKADVIAAVQRLSLADLRRIYDVSTIVSNISDAVKARLKSLPEMQLQSIGLELAAGRKNDSVTDKVGAFTELTKKFSEQEVLGCMEISATKVAALRNQNNPAETKKDSALWADKILGPFMTRDFTAPILKKIDK